MSIRTARVAEEIQKILGERLVRGLRDPLPGFVTIRAVEVTSDFGHAKIFVSVFGSDAQKQGAIEGLRAQKGALRKEVGTKVRLRQTPDLQFVLDESAERAARVHALLDEARVRDANAKTAADAKEAAPPAQAEASTAEPPKPAKPVSAVVDAQHAVATSDIAQARAVVAAETPAKAPANAAATKPPSTSTSTPPPPRKQTPAEKTAAKKTPAKKTPAKKPPAKKPPAQKPAAKKPAAKQAPAKKTATTQKASATTKGKR